MGDKRSLLVVGSIALDSIRTPWGNVGQVLGGSATYAALAARWWTRVYLVGVVGSDFPLSYRRLFDRCGIETQGLAYKEGKTFRWKGRYDVELKPRTLRLELGVFQGFRPQLSPTLQRVQVAFLGNIHPALQRKVLEQLKAPRLTACDSRDDWIENERRGFLKVLKRVDLVFLNDLETRLLTGIHGLVQATQALARLGPKAAIVKKGEHGVLAASGDLLFTLPGYPVSRVVDPTGAGDAFAGACLGYLATQPKMTWDSLCRAIVYASAAASMTIEAFGPQRLTHAAKADVERRAKLFQRLTHGLAL